MIDTARLPADCEVWTSGDVTLIRGDSVRIIDAIETTSIAMIATDPPYSSGGAFRGDRMASTRAKYQSSDVKTEFASFSGDNRDQRGWAAWVAMWMGASQRVTAPGGVACLFTDWRQLPSTTDAIQAGGWVWRGIVPWDKVNARPQPGRFRAQAEFIVWGTNGPRELSYEGSRYHDGAFRIGSPPTADREHATQKPVLLMEKIVEVADPGGVVFDPFAGSGTTGVACVNTGRRFIGCEMSPEYFEVAKRRILAAQAAKAELLVA